MGRVYTNLAAKEILRRIFPYSILIIFCWWTYRYILANQEYFVSAFSIHWKWIAVLAIAVVINHSFNGVLAKLVSEPFGVHLYVVEATSLSIIASVMNHFLPLRAGAIYRAYYLKSRHGLPLSQFSVFFGSYYLLDFLIKSAVGILICSYCYFTGIVVPSFIIIVFILLAIVLTAIMTFDGYYCDNIYLTPCNKLVVLLRSWHNLRKDSYLLRNVFVVLAAQTLLTGIALKISFSATGLSMPYALAILVDIVGSFGMIFSVTPGGIGIVETLYLLTSTVVGIRTEDMLMVALIRRGTGIGTLLLCSPVCYLILRRYCQNNGNDA